MDYPFPFRLLPRNVWTNADFPPNYSAWSEFPDGCYFSVSYGTGRYT